MPNPLSTTHWPAAVAQLRKVLSPDMFERWFADLRPVGEEGDRLDLAVANEFLGEWLQDNYRDLILKALCAVGAPKETTVHFVVREPDSGATPPADNPAAASSGEAPAAHPVRGARAPAPRANLNEQYTFEEFVVGPCNSFAHAAAEAVAKKPGTVYNPLFIYGPTALGKTHLMQAVGHAVQNADSSMRVAYVTTETLLNEYIEAINAKTTGEFRNRYRSVDVLLVDDIQFLVGKEGLQEEFFHTFNALHNSHKQIILTCDRPLKELQGLEQRLVSRFGWGLVTSIEKPSFETRMAILQWKQRDNTCKLPNDQLMFIAEHVTSNVRSLEGALARALSFVSLTGHPLTLDTLREQLSDIVEQDTLPNLSSNTIQKAVAEVFEVSLEDLSGPGRPQSIAVPRQVAMYLCRRMTQASLAEIAKWFDRNHATVVHACKTIRGRMETDPEVNAKVVSIVRRLGRDPHVVLDD